jgi:hypothetical protein
LRRRLGDDRQLHESPDIPGSSPEPGDRDVGQESSLIRDDADPVERAVNLVVKLPHGLVRCYSDPERIRPALPIELTESRQ